MVGVWQPLTLWYFNNKYSYSDILLFDKTNPTLPFLSIQNLIWYHTLIDTINYYVTIFLWYSKLPHDYTPIIIQQAIIMSYTPIDTTLLRYSNSMIQHAITSPLLWYNNLICYYSPIDTTNYYVNILLLIQQSHSTILQLIQQVICSLTHQHWYNNPLQYYISIDSASYYVHTNDLNTMILIQQSQLLLFNNDSARFL